MDNSNILKGRRLRHRGRTLQVPIYLGKLLRGFIYMNDWKMLPMAAVIAALVSMVVRNGFCQTMEGTLKGSFALTFVAIWNGCFNSIQVICRERPIVKREHRSGMHVAAYVLAHMIYQALLCLAQTLITLYVSRMAGVRFPAEGFITKFALLDFGITIFLLTYASDLLSLLVSAIAHSTTAAMTVMPFLLIFQLVFSGGMFSLPKWSDNFSRFTLSNYGLKCIAAQADYNNLDMVTGWNTLNKLRDEEIVLDTDLGQIIDFLGSDEYDLSSQLRSVELSEGLNLGTVIDLCKDSEDLQAHRGDVIPVRFTLAQILEYTGEENAKSTIQQKTSEASRVDAYSLTRENIFGYWLFIIKFGAVCALLTAIVLKFIDRDRR